MAPTSQIIIVLLYLLASNILLITKLASTKVNTEKEIDRKTQLVGEVFTAGDFDEATYITAEIARLRSFLSLAPRYQDRYHQLMVTVTSVEFGCRLMIGI